MSKRRSQAAMSTRGDMVRGWAHHLAQCECGKRSYNDKATAKAARNRIDRTLRVYRCEQSGFWHLGHVPDAVRHGEVDRDTWKAHHR